MLIDDSAAASDDADTDDNASGQDNTFTVSDGQIVGMPADIQQHQDDIANSEAHTVENRDEETALGASISEAEAAHERGIGNQTADSLGDAINQTLDQLNANKS